MKLTSSAGRTVGINKVLRWSKNDPIDPKVTKVTDPANTILFGDGFGHDYVPNGKSYSESIYYTGSRLGTEEDFIHDGRKNFIHVDGHTESNTRAYITNNPDLWDYN